MVLSLGDLNGRKKNRYSGMMTPLVFNSVWLAWSLLVIMLSLGWAIISGKTAASFDRQATKGLNLLAGVVEAWDKGDDVSNSQLQEIFAIYRSVISTLDDICGMIKGWAGTWMFLGICLFIVSESASL